MDAVVFGNITLDILCYPVEEVPRHDSLSFEQVLISPGGCGSNVAIGLCALGVSTALVGCLGEGDSADLILRYYARSGLDTRFLRRIPQAPQAVSVGLVDLARQPRFIHTPGANARLTADDLDVDALAAEGARALHVGGFFVLPGVMDGRLAGPLAVARSRGLFTSLDVVNHPRMDAPAPLWPCLPYVDYFLCNAHEAQRLTGETDPAAAAGWLRRRGARTVIVKLGAAGCWADSDAWSGQVPAPDIQVVDTTGAGDAFAAGLIAALLRGADLPAACQSANAAGARMVGALGAIAGWFTV